MIDFGSWLAAQTAQALNPEDPELDWPMELQCPSCEKWVEIEMTVREFNALPSHKQDGAAYCGGTSWCCP